MFVFAASNLQRDIITDFDAGNDRFELLGLGFGVDAGTNLNAGTTFVANAAPVAVVGEATMLYETDTGRLYWDVDGTGAQAAVLIARLTGAPTVTAQDFIFV